MALPLQPIERDVDGCERDLLGLEEIFHLLVDGDAVLPGVSEG